MLSVRAGCEGLRVPSWTESRRCSPGRTWPGSVLLSHTHTLHLTPYTSHRPASSRDTSTQLQYIREHFSFFFCSSEIFEHFYVVGAGSNEGPRQLKLWQCDSWGAAVDRLHPEGQDNRQQSSLRVILTSPVSPLSSWVWWWCGLSQSHFSSIQNTAGGGWGMWCGAGAGGEGKGEGWDGVGGRSIVGRGFEFEGRFWEEWGVVRSVINWSLEIRFGEQMACWILSKMYQFCPIYPASVMRYQPGRQPSKVIVKILLAL